MSKLSEIDGLGDEVDDEDDFLPPTCDCSGIMFRCRIMLLPSPFFLRSAANMDKRDQQNINELVQGNNCAHDEMLLQTASAALYL